MNQSWYIRFFWWLCEKAGHPLSHGWVYAGEYHRDCRLCGRIISEPIRARGEK